MKKESKKESKIKFIWKFLQFESIFDAGKGMLSIILSAMAINYWLQFSMTFPDITLRYWFYAITPVIPIYLSAKNLQEIFNDEKETKE